MAQLTVKRTALNAEGKPEETEETSEASDVNVQVGSSSGLQRFQLLPGESVSVELVEPEPEKPKSSKKKGK